MRARALWGKATKWIETAKKKKEKKRKTDIRDAALSNNVNCCNFDYATDSPVSRESKRDEQSSIF